MGAFWIVGRGRQTQVALEAAESCGLDVGGFMADSAGEGLGDLDLPIVVPIGLETIQRYHIREAIIAVGDNRLRKEIAERLISLVQWKVVVHRDAMVTSSSKLGVGTCVSAGAIIQPEAKVGEHCIVSAGAIVAHHSVTGDFAHIAPGAVLNGSVRVCDGAMIGANSVVLPGVTIGESAVVGAGCVVLADVPDGVTVVGNPARLV